MSRAKANYYDLYDFDHTIYDGDCSLDFYFFCIRRRPILLIYAPFQILNFLLFAAKLEDRTQFKARFFVFLRHLKNTSKMVDEFWESHFRKIKSWYLTQDHSRDIIISASPEFLLRPAFAKLKAHTLIATIMNSKTGQVRGKNCRGPEKVARLKKAMGAPQIRKAYSDSLADLPILNLAQQKYIVKANEIRELS